MAKNRSRDSSVSKIGRRSLLKAAAGATFASVASAAQAQVTGLTPGGGTVPFKLPMGALDFLDRNQYISNMEIISFVPEKMIAGGEPLMNMWAKGARRLLQAGGGWMDISEPKKPVFIETKSDRGAVAYNTRLKKWLSVSSAAATYTIATPEHPTGRYDPVLMERAKAFKGLRGIRVHDITNPEKQDTLCEFSTGDDGGPGHMNFYDGGRYAYIDAGYSGDLRMENANRPWSSALMVVDLMDPANVKEVWRWHVPGQMIGEEAEYNKYRFAGDGSSWPSSHGAPVVPVRVEDGGRYGYGGFGHFGMWVFDFDGFKNPKPVGSVRWDYESIGGIPYHTVYPLHTKPGDKLHNLIVVLPEAIQPDCREGQKAPYVIDASDPTKPKIIGIFPLPEAPPNAPYAHFCQARGRFSSHNCQAWVAPGTARPEIVVMSYFNAGFRVYDISDPREPKEIAYFLPPRVGEMEKYESWYRGVGETVFIEWDRNLIWVGARGGTYCLSCPQLGKPVLEAKKIDHWTAPHLNAGWDG